MDPKDVSKIIKMTTEAVSDGKKSKQTKKSGKEQKEAPVREINGVFNNMGSGDINFNGNMSIITNQAPSPIRRKVVEIPPEGSIDTAQKAEITNLVKDWVEAHNAVKKKKLSIQAAWIAFNKHFRIHSYSFLPSERFGDARKWLKQQKARINSMKSAPKNVQGWRTDRIKGIKARCKNQLGDEFYYRHYIEMKFQKTSLGQLSDNELNDTYIYVFSKK